MRSTPASDDPTALAVPMDRTERRIAVQQFAMLSREPSLSGTEMMALAYIARALHLMCLARGCTPATWEDTQTPSYL